MSDHWALITGASSGIGAELSREYAASGYNVIIVARREEHLQALAQDVESQYGVNTLCIVQDLSKPNAAKHIYQIVQQQSIDVDVLVNNAGYGLGKPFIKTSWREIDDFLHVMISAITELTHHFLPGMLARNRGAVVFVASIAGHLPGIAPMTLYNAAKSFMIKFGQALWGEAKPYGVHVTVACPGFTKTDFQKTAGIEELRKSTIPEAFWMEPTVVAKKILHASKCNKPLITIGWYNKLIPLLVRFTPNWLWHRLTHSSTRD